MPLHVLHFISDRSKRSLLLKSGVLLFLLIACFCSWSMGRLRAADSSQKNFTSVTQEDMNQIENLHERAEDLISHRKFRDAINVYSEIVLTEPDDEDAYANMGQAYMVLGDFKRAKDAFQNALYIDPENEIAMLGLKKIADPDFSATPKKLIERPERKVFTAPPPARAIHPSAAAAEKAVPLLIPKQTPVILTRVAQPKPLAATLPILADKPMLMALVKVDAPEFVETKPPILAAKPMTITLTRGVDQPKPLAVTLPLLADKPILTASVKVAEPKSPAATPPILAAKPIPIPAHLSSDINAILSSPLSFNQFTQIALKNAGLYRGPIDGIINEGTQKAIETFQKNNHLEIDGMAGPETWSKLKSYLDKKN